MYVLSTPFDKLKENCYVNSHKLIFIISIPICDLLAIHTSNELNL